jgi:hypothetical protein
MQPPFSYFMNFKQMLLAISKKKSSQSSDPYIKQSFTSPVIMRLTEDGASFGRRLGRHL